MTPSPQKEVWAKLTLADRRGGTSKLVLSIQIIILMGKRKLLSREKLCIKSPQQVGTVLGASHIFGSGNMGGPSFLQESRL